MDSAPRDLSAAGFSAPTDIGVAKKQNANVGAFLDIREKRHAPDFGAFNFARFEKLHQEMHRACCISMRAPPPTERAQNRKMHFCPSSKHGSFSGAFFIFRFL